MNEVLGVVGPIVTVVGVIVVGWLTTRASKTAAAMQAEPSQRQADLQIFKEIREQRERDLAETKQELQSLRSLVRAFAGYVGALTSQMRQQGIEPPAPPDRVDEYNRTGV
ncbi:hypothetical protein ACFQ9J_28320 [Streptomyces sp. NPDC056529]|uniref:hypothetical protein n=1 Tax=Streptomyces sp. NPDC056529 TaxID=3345855 RepID=UPI0036AD43B8